jgi:hypothetical protein
VKVQQLHQLDFLVVLPEIYRIIPLVHNIP